MKEAQFSDLPVTDQTTLALITLIEVVQEKGVPPLPHKWEFKKGYTQERENYSAAPYLDLICHRDSGKPFIRDNARLFSLHFDYLAPFGAGVSDTFALVFNYYLRNKVAATWILDRDSVLDYNSLHSFISNNFNRAHQYDMVRYVSEVLGVVYNYGGIVPRKLHLTGVQYKLLRKKTEVERLIVDATLFIESVRNLNQIEYNDALVNPIFGDDLDCLPNGFIKVQFLTPPTNGHSTVVMELGSSYNSKHFNLSSNTLWYLLERGQVFDKYTDVEYLVDLFERFMSFLVSQDYYVTPNKTYSKEQTYLLHEVDDHASEIKKILEYFNLNYIYFLTKTNVLEDVYCYFY